MICICCICLEVIEMVRVSAADLQRQWGKVQDMALAEPVTVTCKGRDRIVLLSVEEYGRPKRRDRQMMTLAVAVEPGTVQDRVTAIERVLHGAVG
jgi:hypothetical protein